LPLLHRRSSSARRLSPARAHGHERCLSASRLRSTPGRVLRVWLFTLPEAAPLFGFPLLQAHSLDRVPARAATFRSCCWPARSSFARASFRSSGRSLTSRLSIALAVGTRDLSPRDAALGGSPCGGLARAHRPLLPSCSPLGHHARVPLRPAPRGACSKAYVVGRHSMLSHLRKQSGLRRRAHLAMLTIARLRVHLAMLVAARIRAHLRAPVRVPPRSLHDARGRSAGMLTFVRMSARAPTVTSRCSRSLGGHAHFRAHVRARAHGHLAVSAFAPEPAGALRHPRAPGWLRFASRAPLSTLAVASSCDARARASRSCCLG